MICFVEQYVYLGNVLDNTLTLSKNFDRAYKRASSRLRLLKNVRSYLNTDSATKIYNMMILPLLTYAGPIKSVFTKTQIQHLNSLHRRANVVTRNKLLKSPVNEITLQNCLLVRKCLEMKTNSYIFDNYFKMKIHKHNTRNNNKSLELPKVKLEKGRQSFYFQGSKIYNNLPIYVRSSERFSEFKLLISKHF